MRVYGTKEIRNIGIVGHGDAGKTSLTEAMLYTAGAIQRLGSVNDGTTVTDYDEDERARHITIRSSLAYSEWGGAKINIIDTPGYNAFIQDARTVLRVCDTALVVVDAVAGVEVQTEKAWSYADEFKLPRMIVINKLDRDRADFRAALASINETFGRAAIPFHLPIGAEKEFSGIIDLIKMRAYTFQTDTSGKFAESDIPDALKADAEKARESLVEMVAEGSDALMEKFFEEGTLSDEDLVGGIKSGVLEGRLIPVFLTSATLNVGAQMLLDAIVKYAPSPADIGVTMGRAAEDDGEEIERRIDDAEPYSAFVFRTVADPFAGRITMFRIYSGVFKSDATVYNITKNTQERLGPLHVVQGKQLEKITEAHAGDIVAVTKLKETTTGDTFCDKAAPIFYQPVTFPTPALAFAIEPKSRQDEEKLSTAIAKILEEDLALRYERDAQTKEFLLRGTGPQHVEVTVEKLKRRYNVEVVLHPPKVPYLETIKSRAEVQGRHKKQTGGRGQFGDCKCVFEPLPRGGGFEFVDKIFGGAIPQQWRPAVEKGIKDAAAKGAVAGYPVVDFKVELIDGSYHTVDSDDLSFQLAGRKAFRAAMEKANPVLLEPIMNVEIVAPLEYSGDLMGDLNSRRGRIQGMDSRGTQQVIKAQVPMSEMLSYQSTLNSITAGRGTYTMELSHYDEVPAHLASKIIAQAQAEGRVRAAEEE